MNSTSRLVLTMSLLLTVGADCGLAQVEEAGSVKFGEAAQAFAAGSIQKFSPRDGIVNLITGDNQTTGNRMLLGKQDLFYLKLKDTHDVAVGDLYTVYRRVRKVFHPTTNEYLGFATIRLAVVRVLDVDHALTTVEAIRAYGSVSPGDLVMRFSEPTADEEMVPADLHGDVAGMIVEVQADKTVTLVAQSDIVYLDRGRVDGLKPGDLVDVYRRSAGLPSRKIGQLKVLATEDRTATAKVTKANTRMMKGDRYKATGFSAPLVDFLQPVPSDMSGGIARKLQAKDSSGQSRINLGDLEKFLHYDSGEAIIRPAGYKVLDQFIQYIQTAGDERLIRVEGHADNVEIGPTLRSRYATNWDLSKARANGILRYLIEKGGLDSARLSAVGYGDSRPVASNLNEEGRTRNRRVEILLYAPRTNPEAPKAERSVPERSRTTRSDQPGAADLTSSATVSATRSGLSTPEAVDTATGRDADGKPLPDSEGAPDPVIPLKPSTE
ncbi:MAG: OmpA family protein [Nitrospiraceae bacterium]|nr:OmpA family protein [Nitrospiraceae bacterium]